MTRPDMNFDIHFECPRCAQPIDAPLELANELIDCPTCKEKIKVPARSQPKGAPKPTPAPPPAPVTPKSSQTVVSSQSSGGGSVFFVLAGIGLIIVGLFLVGSGLSGEADESTRLERSAIRETVYAVQYGTGFIVIALGLILEALNSILAKR